MKQPIFLALLLFIPFALNACASGSSPTSITRNGAGEGGDIADSDSESGPSEFPSVMSAVGVAISGSANYRSLTSANPFSFSVNKSRSGNYQQEDEIFNLGPSILGGGE